MSRRWLLSLLCLSVTLLLFVQLASASSTLAIIESDTRFVFGPDESHVSLALEHSRGRANVIIRLDLLTPEDIAAASVEHVVTLGHGKQKLNLTIPFKVSLLPVKDNSRLLWYRLRCRIDPQNSADKLEPIERVISLSRITPELFEIRVFKSPMIHEGMRYQTRVKAAHPLTNKPARGVQLEGNLRFTGQGSGREDTLRATAMTDRDGYALLQFDFPRSLRAADLEQTVVGKRGPLTVHANQELLYYDQSTVLVSTDKPIYQPGQILHLRALALGLSMHALAGQTLALKISDPEDTLLFRAEVQTNRFGVGAVDWPIPDTSRLGDYSIAFELQGEQVSVRHFKVSRYELPNFSITAKPDRSYYLPGQSAEVEVHADYLFGQPVTRGHVRVVRETERKWNHAEQKYDIKEGDKYEGETDAQGRFRAKIDLSADFEELKYEAYQRFNDLRYAAYFTDPSTNRTEQRRFDLRLTKDAVHVYVISASDRSRFSRRLPLTFYVSTFYADGTPARCKVRISRRGDETSSRRLLTSVRTNSFGVARVDNLPLPRDVQDGDDLNVRLTAHDRTGRAGTFDEAFRLFDEPAIRVNTDKSLYAAGEPVTVTITSSERSLATILEVVSDWTTLQSETVQLYDGRATIVLPYREEFKDDLTIVAYADTTGNDPTLGLRKILFPRNRNLQLDVKTTQDTYRPGEDAHVNFRVRDRDGRLSESALGVVVFDKAVEERARTDSDFGSSGADFSGDLVNWLGARNSVAGISRSNLDALDLSRSIPPGLELAVEVFLNSSSSYFLETFGGEYYAKDPQPIFRELIRNRLSSMREALKAHYEHTREYPANAESLRRILGPAGIELGALRDPWGKPLHAVFFVEKQSDALRLESAGPDKRLGSDDDFTVERFDWAYFLPVGEAIDRAIQSYHSRTGAFIRDLGTLSNELATQGIDLGALRDRWSRPYQFEFGVRQNWFTLNVSSLGPNGRLDGNYSDDFSLWTSNIDYFAEPRAVMNSVLVAWAKANNRFTQSEDDFREALRGAGIDLGGLRDAWGRPYSPIVAIQTVYGDRAHVENRARFGEEAKERIEIKPVTRRIGTIRLHSAGPDGKLNTLDDFDVACFTGVLSEQAAEEPAPQVPHSFAVLNGSNGAIGGVILDRNQAVIAGASVRATASGTASSFQAKSDADGKYMLANLPPGPYEVRFEAVGFKTIVMEQVFVTSANMVEVNATLEAGAVTETVTVTAEATQTQTQSSELASTITSRRVLSLPVSGRNRAQKLMTITKSGTQTSSTP